MDNGPDSLRGSAVHAVALACYTANVDGAPIGHWSAKTIASWYINDCLQTTVFLAHGIIMKSGPLSSPADDLWNHFTMDGTLYDAAPVLDQGFLYCLQNYLNEREERGELGSPPGWTELTNEQGENSGNN